jgi:hypothetical protein
MMSNNGTGNSLKQRVLYSFKREDEILDIPPICLARHPPFRQKPDAHRNFVDKSPDLLNRGLSETMLMKLRDSSCDVKPDALVGAIRDAAPRG